MRLKETVDNHRNMWKEIADTGKSKREWLLKNGFDPDNMFSECFMCQYVYERNMVKIEDGVARCLDCAQCPLKWDFLGHNDTCMESNGLWEMYKTKLDDGIHDRRLAKLIASTPLKPEYQELYDMEDEQ